jgi:uncharacterized membrane protein
LTFLRRVLLADALASLGSAALLIAAPGPLAWLTGLPKPLLLETGLVLVPFVLLLLAVAAPRATSRAGVRAIVAINGLWVIGSAAVLAANAPTALGYVLVIVQAVAVAVLAALQAAGLKRQSQATT